MPENKPTLSKALTVVGGMLAVMWVLEAIDAVTLNALDSFGIQPRLIGDLPNILLAPFLHFGWAHLISNSVPFLVLGVLIFITSGPKHWFMVTVIGTVVSGLVAWLLSASGTITAGASGVVFAYLTYLLTRGLFTKRIGQILIAVVVFAAYGTVLWGVLPGAEGVSWQGHLGGAIGGVLAAWWLHARGETRSVRS